MSFPGWWISQRFPSPFEASSVQGSPKLRCSDVSSLKSLIWIHSHINNVNLFSIPHHSVCSFTDIRMRSRRSGTSWSSTASSQAREGPTTAPSWGPRIGTSTKTSTLGSTILRYNINMSTIFVKFIISPGLSSAQGLQGVLDEPSRLVRGWLHGDG